MTDKELADALVALGIGEQDRGFYVLQDFPEEWLNENEFVRDWRVAGAVMEKWPRKDDREMEIGIDENGLYYCVLTHSRGSQTNPSLVPSTRRA